MAALWSLVLLMVPGMCVLPAAAFGQESTRICPNDPKAFGLVAGTTRSFTYVSEVTGEAHIWARLSSVDATSSHDLTLEVRDAGARRTDEESGGGTTPYLLLDVKKGATYTVLVTAKPCALTDDSPARVTVAAIEVRADLGAREASKTLEALAAEMKLLREQGDFAAARAGAEEAIALLKSLAPPPWPSSLTSRIFDVASESWQAHDLASSRTLLEQVLSARERTLPVDHPDLFRTRLNHAGTLYLLGDLSSAHTHLEELVAGCGRTLPEEHPHLQLARLSLAATLKALGNLQSAQEIEESALAVFERTLPEEHPHLQLARGNYAATLKALGDLQSALTLEKKVLAVYERTLPEEHPSLLLARGNYAVTLRDLGDFVSARRLEERVLFVYEKTLPEEHPDLQVARMNHAGTLLKLAELSPARDLLEKVLAVYERTLPDEHPEFLLAQGIYAAVLRGLDDLRSARELYEKILAVRARTASEEGLNHQRDRLNYAGVLHALGDLSAARKVEEKLLVDYEKTLPGGHPDLQLARGNHALTLFAVGASAEHALSEHVAESLERTLAHCGGVVAEGGSRSIAIAAHRKSRVVSIALSVVPPGQIQRIDRAAFRLAEELVTLVPRAHRLRRILPAVSGDALEQIEEARRNVRKYSVQMERFLAQTNRASDAAKPRRLAEIARKREGAERDLVRELMAIAGGGAHLEPVEIKEIAGALPRSSVGVFYQSYARWRREETKAGRSVRCRNYHLVAFVLAPGGVVTRVDLGETRAISDRIHRYRALLGKPLGRSGGRPAGERTSSLDECGKQLRKALIDPVIAAAGEDTRRLVIVLTDVLHALPMDALPLDKGCLADRYAIDFVRGLSSPARGYVRRELNAPSLLALGGIDFLGAPRPIDEKNEEDADLLAKPHRGPQDEVGAPVWEQYFSELPYSREEVQAIAETFTRAFKDEDTVHTLRVLTDDRADKTRFIALAPKARYLHLATHGFFAPDSIPSILDDHPTLKQYGIRPADLREELHGYEPLSLCGLALAGAMLPPKEDGTTPGLLTGNEIAALDLSGVELAVLSACDTSLGVRRAGQGIMSLQEALLSAGVRHSLTSLWTVPDEATNKLMSRFYEGIWRRGETKREALWNAKKMLRDEKDPSTGKLRYRPRDWAAWVLFGTPEG